MSKIIFTKSDIENNNQLNIEYEMRLYYQSVGNTNSLSCLIDSINTAFYCKDKNDIIKKSKSIINMYLNYWLDGDDNDLCDFYNHILENNFNYDPIINGFVYKYDTNYRKEYKDYITISDNIIINGK